MFIIISTSFFVFTWSATFSSWFFSLFCCMFRFSCLMRSVFELCILFFSIPYSCQWSWINIYFLFIHFFVITPKFQIQIQIQFVSLNVFSNNDDNFIFSSLQEMSVQIMIHNPVNHHLKESKIEKLIMGNNKYK